jgi:hypothetical protein
VTQKRRRGTHQQSNFHLVVSAGSLRGVGLPIIDLNGRATEFFNRCILDFFNSIGQSRLKNRCPHNVRFPSDSNRIADITPRRRRARRRLMHRSEERRYSMTLSARASSMGDTVRPRAVAVLRLITSSNLIGCSTGKSAGLAPFSILSTNVAARRNKSEISVP